MLGIAFRFAIYNMFAAKLGFVILDEPTTHLDNDNVDIIADMLRAVRGHALSSGLQVIVPTHERALWSAFDHAVHV
jgi:DNA repair exonuclease SbcCD ATPase subunit